MNLDAVTALLEDVFDTFCIDENMHDIADRRALFVFHMVDWIEDLEELHALYSDAKNMDKKHARQIVFSFLTHVLPHLSEAGRAMLGKIANPFDSESGP